MIALADFVNNYLYVHRRGNLSKLRKRSTFIIFILELLSHTICLFFDVLYKFSVQFLLTLNVFYLFYVKPHLVNSYSWVARATKLGVYPSFTFFLRQLYIMYLVHS